MHGIRLSCQHDQPQVLVHLFGAAVLPFDKGSGFRSAGGSERTFRWCRPIERFHIEVNNFPGCLPRDRALPSTVGSLGHGPRNKRNVTIDPVVKCGTRHAVWIIDLHGNGDILVGFRDDWTVRQMFVGRRGISLIGRVSCAWCSMALGLIQNERGGDLIVVKFRVQLRRAMQPLCAQRNLVLCAEPDGVQFCGAFFLEAGLHDVVHVVQRVGGHDAECRVCAIILNMRGHVCSKKTPVIVAICH